MPREKFDLEVKDNGRYATKGLDNRTFLQAFKVIKKAQAERRRHAGHTVTPAILKGKKQADIVKLGKKQNGVPFTIEDLVKLEKKKDAFAKKYDKNTAGITYRELIAGSLDIDIRRANNKVDDGSGIKMAHIAGLLNNTITFNVIASTKNGDDNHQVVMRLEEWDHLLQEAEPTLKGYQKAVKEAVKGRMSIDCSCGRHQYWLRYMATVGNYAVSPPKEFSPPAQRNASLEGVACKHVLHVANKLQSPGWINQLAPHMRSIAQRAGFADDKKLKHVFTETEVKQQKRTRKGKINQDKFKKELDLYQKRQAKMAEKQAADKGKLDKIRKQITKERRRAERAENKANKAVKTAFKATREVLLDAGQTEKQIRSLFAKKMNLTVKQLGTIVDD